MGLFGSLLGSLTGSLNNNLQSNLMSSVAGLLGQSGGIQGLLTKVIGHGLGDLASILDPGLITIGGGLSETSFRDWFIGEVRKGFAERAMLPYQRCPLPPHEPTTRIEWAIGGDGAAAYGSARKAMQLAFGNHA